MLAGFQNVTFEFGARTILEDATWHIQPDEHIGLIGYNGTGKSTLLKLLAGEYSPSAGTVERSRSTSIGYLHQDLLSFDTGDSILKVAMGAFEKVLTLEKELEDLAHALESGMTRKEPASRNRNAYSSTPINCMKWICWTDTISIIKQKKSCRGLDFPMPDLQRPLPRIQRWLADACTAGKNDSSETGSSAAG